MPKKISARDVYWFVPNLIGYIRFATAILSFALAFDYPGATLLLYAASFLLDGADGYAARLLDQCSCFGAVLDMIADRGATAAFIVVLTHVVPLAKPFIFVAALLVMLDIVSHFARMYASLKSDKGSHKDVDPNTFALLRVYYGNRKFLGAMCVGQEFFYIMLYALNFYSIPFGFELTFYVLLPMCALKQYINVLQLVDAMRVIAASDVAERNARAK